MAYFYAETPKSPGGRPKWKILADTIEELLTLAREYPEARLTLPPRKKLALKDKKQSNLYVLLPADRLDILEALDAAKVSDQHMAMISYMLRKEYWGSRYGFTEDEEHQFDLEIRGKLIRVLERGMWVDEPENLGLKNWNNRVRKLDLGRRSDLNFSSVQSDIKKYDADAKRDDLDEEPIWLHTYRNSTSEERKKLYLELDSFQQYRIRQIFGEP